MIGKYRDYMENAKREYFRTLMAENKHNVRLAAKAAGVNRTHLYKAIAACGLKEKKQYGNEKWQALGRGIDLDTVSLSPKESVTANVGDRNGKTNAGAYRVFDSAERLRKRAEANRDRAHR